MRWDPQQYGRYAGERARPFLDLLARVGAHAPRHIVDLGCGPGTMTALLSRRWPDAFVEGIDSSPEMIEAAEQLAGERLRFRLADVREWAVPDSCDVVVTNATLQWVPGHRELLGQWAASLAPEGWLAMQVPGNFASPSHVELRRLAQDGPWAEALAGALRHDDAVAAPEEYAAVLLDAGLQVDVWETTYLHVLSGADPVLDWLRGTALRPMLAVLDEDAAEAFTAELGSRLRAAYPAGPHGTVFPFRRIFAVGHKDRAERETGRP